MSVVFGHLLHSSGKLKDSPKFWIYTELLIFPINIYWALICEFPPGKHPYAEQCSVLWNFYSIGKDGYGPLWHNPVLPPFRVPFLNECHGGIHSDAKLETFLLLHVQWATWSHLSYFCTVPPIYHLVSTHSSLLSSGHCHCPFGWLRQPVKCPPTSSRSLLWSLRSQRNCPNVQTWPCYAQADRESSEVSLLSTLTQGDKTLRARRPIGSYSPNGCGISSPASLSL